MELAQAVIQECLAAGVKAFCVCAGSRNSSLVLEVCALVERRGAECGLRLYHFFEERSAGFFALGRARRTGRPAAVLTTSGTAAAELLPAMIEAHYQGLPLLAVTADRPRRFRRSGAPQAIEQPGLFGVYANPAPDVAEPGEAKGSLRSWTLKGPSHLNVCVEEPVQRQASKEQGHPAPAAETKRVSTIEQTAKIDPAWSNPEGLLILAGDLLPHEQSWAGALIEQAGNVPVWAEEASGFRREKLPGAAWLVRGGEATLRHLPIRRVLRVGGVPSCRFWRDLETRPEIEVLSYSRSGHSGLARSSLVDPIGGQLPEVSCRWDAAPWMALDSRQQPDRLLDVHPNSECAHLRSLSRIIPPQSALFLGNSLAIREWNLAADLTAGPWNTHVMRGANGIDGNLSYFLGLGADDAESWAVVGDLTALYDLAAPWILPQLPPARRRIVVINNGGGKIFSRLPSLQGLPSHETRVIENSHALRLDAWAKMWGWDYLRIESAQEWKPADSSNSVVIEVLPDAGQSEAFWKASSRLEQEVWK